MAFCLVWFSRHLRARRSWHRLQKLDFRSNAANERRIRFLPSNFTFHSLNNMCRWTSHLRSARSRICSPYERSEQFAPIETGQDRGLSDRRTQIKWNSKEWNLKEWNSKEWKHENINRARVYWDEWKQQCSKFGTSSPKSKGSHIDQHCEVHRTQLMDGEVLSSKLESEFCKTTKSSDLVGWICPHTQFACVELDRHPHIHRYIQTYIYIPPSCKILTCKK